MASTFSTSLNLELMSTGENSGTWGTKLNDNFDDLDDAIAARLSKSVAGSSDITLTTAESINIWHEYNGTLTGSINVKVITKEMCYWVFNNTGGAFTLTVKTSAGTGILVPQGQTMLLYCDGTNVVAGANFTGQSGAALTFDPGASQIVTNTSAALLKIENTNAITVPSGTAGIAAGLWVTVPNWTATGTITTSATVYIEGPATEGSTDYSLWVDDGPTQLDGTLDVGGTTTLAALTLSGAVTGADQTVSAIKLKDYGEVVKVHGNLNSATNANFEDGNVHSFTVTGSFTLTLTNPPASGTAGSITFEITNGGSSTLTWDPQIIWPGGNAPSLTASGPDTVTVYTTNAGTTIYGFAAGLDFS